MSKSCGPLIKPIEIGASLEFVGSSIRAGFPIPFLGERSLLVNYDPKGGPSATHLEKRVDLGTTRATLALDLQLDVKDDGEGPKIDFTAHFRKTADDPAWNCAVTARGSTTKTPVH